MTDEPSRDHPGPPLESTLNLLELFRQGDRSARDRLIERYLPILRSWAHGRLPARARSLSDTDDLVQNALLRALDHLEEFQVRREGAFLAYLRRIVLNAVRDELRRGANSPSRTEVTEDFAAPGESALDQAMGRETVEAYEAALSRLPEETQEAVILRIEFGYSYDQIAEALGKPSANAARMTVARALVQLAEVMGERLQ